MKTVWILLRDLTETGGGERVCANLANAWCDRFNVRVWSFHKGNAEPMVPLRPEVGVTYLSKGFQRAGNPFLKRFRGRRHVFKGNGGMLHIPGIDPPAQA